MALPELFSNPPTPGGSVPWQLGTLSGAINATTTSITLSASPPSSLAQSGQFRIVIDNEIMLDITGGSGTARTVVRAQEGTTGAAHANGASAYHILTSGALGNFVQSNSSPTFAVVNVTGSYEVNGNPLQASHLSNGVTGSGAVVLASSPTLSGGTWNGGNIQQNTGESVVVGSGGLTVNTSGVGSGGGATINGTVTQVPTLNANGYECASPSGSYSGKGFRQVLNGTNVFYVDGGGQVHSSSGSIGSISDRALKSDITALDGALEKILALHPRRFTWKEHALTEGRVGDEAFGLVADEVESVLPHLVGDYSASDEKEETLKELCYGDLIPFLVGAIQELSEKLDHLETAHV